jgi:3-hydroxyacyl-[acyl-carrier-protein] dehydratase
MEMKFTFDEVRNWLPHREPFIFVDSVQSVILDNQKNPEELSSKDLIGGKVLANYFTDPDHPIFRGHFPTRPILPGVIQVEMMAQASSFIMGKLFVDPKSLKSKMEVVLASICKAKFRKAIYPSMKLELHSTCKKVRGQMVEQDCEIYHNGELMSEATVLASVKFV